jgi:PAS domain S-box-containing protein
MWINTILISIILLSVATDLVLIIYVYKKRHLKKEKIHLTKLLERSEEIRIKTEAERKKISLVFNNFTDGIIILDEQDKIFLINPEALKILELDVEKLLGKSFKMMTYFPKTKPIESILSAGLKNIYRKEIILDKDFIIELSVVPLDLGRNTTNHLLIIHDISKEKIISKMKTEFVSLTAHQLRTPLSTIKWSMSMLKKGDFGKLTKKQNEVIENTSQSNEGLLSLVDDLLNVTHIEEGKYLYKTKNTDIREIVTQVVGGCKSELKAKKIKIEFEKPKNFPETLLDSDKIKLTIQNLVDNAIKYSSVNGKINISLKSTDDEIELKIQDYGIGIPKNQQEKIFMEFFRARNAIKKDGVGSGLGLFLSKKIVEAHHGRIWFDSEENKGSTFYLSIPISKK